MVSEIGKGYLSFTTNNGCFLFSNGVSRLKDQAGIRFKKYGIAYTDPIKDLRKESGFGKNGFSIEIALKPSSFQEGFNFILALHNGNDGNQLLLGQWHSWIIAMNGDDYDHKRRVKRISINSGSMPPAIQFITLTTGKDGTKLYFNGRLVKSKKDLRLEIPYGDNARLILGNSAYGKHSWRGNVYGLVFFGRSLTAQEAAGHFERWSQDQIFSFAKKCNPFVLYYFDDKEGKRVSDHAGGDHYLNIPSRMPILEKKFLCWPWERFRHDRKGIEDIVLNLMGFIPLGFVITLTLVGVGGVFKKKAAFMSFILCVVVSLIIEIAQAWMPSRSSSQLDLMCNTAGSVIGIFIANFALKRGYPVSNLD